jgi:hypothetical protein
MSKKRDANVASAGGPEVTSAGVPWSEVPEFARADVAWIDGRNGSAESSLPSVDVVPVPEILHRLPYPHADRPLGSKALLDAAGAKARLRDARPGAWLISPFSGWKWAKWPSGDVGWLPADIELPATLQVGYNERTQPSGTATSANSATSHAEATTKSFGRFQIPVHWKVNETLPSIGK